MENDAVWFVHLDLFPVHDEQTLLEIDIEKCHCVRLVIEGYQMAVIGEQSGILRILAADRKAQDLCQVRWN